MLLHCRRVMCDCGYDFKKACVVYKADQTTPKRRKMSMASLRARERAVKNCLKESKVRMASLRATESSEATKTRLHQNKLRVASLSATESPEAAKIRSEQSKVLMALLRAVQSPQEALVCRIQQRERMSALRNQTVSFQTAITTFYTAINEGPDYVCTVRCHRIM